MNLKLLDLTFTKRRDQSSRVKSKFSNYLSEYRLLETSKTPVIECVFFDVIIFIFL